MYKRQGPEGGQFSIFFAPGVPFDLEHWFTPAPLDTDPYEIISQSKASVAFRRDFSLTNFTGTKFNLRLEREVRLLNGEQIWKGLGIDAVDEMCIRDSRRTPWDSSGCRLYQVGGAARTDTDSIFRESEKHLQQSSRSYWRSVDG